MTIAIDFDGVIHTYEHGWHDGTIYGDFTPDALFALLTLIERDAVFIHTTRNPKQVARWIERTSGHNIDCTTHLPRTWYGHRKPFWNTRGLLLVTDRKLPATVYIDDRAYHFEDWPQALAHLGVDIPGREMGAPVDWKAVAQARERELKTVLTAKQRVTDALAVVHEWQRSGDSPNDYLTRVHKALNPPVSGNSVYAGGEQP